MSFVGGCFVTPPCWNKAATQNRAPTNEVNEALKGIFTNLKKTKHWRRVFKMIASSYNYNLLKPMWAQFQFTLKTNFKRRSARISCFHFRTSRSLRLTYTKLLEKKVWSRFFTYTYLYSLSFIMLLLFTCGKRFPLYSGCSMATEQSKTYRSLCTSGGHFSAKENKQNK